MEYCNVFIKCATLWSDSTAEFDYDVAKVLLSLYFYIQWFAWVRVDFIYKCPTYMPQRALHRKNVINLND